MRRMYALIMATATPARRARAPLRLYNLRSDGRAPPHRDNGGRRGARSERGQDPGLWCFEGLTRGRWNFPIPGFWGPGGFATT